MRAVLEGLAPWNLRVMWASKRFKVRCCAQETASCLSFSCIIAHTEVYSGLRKKAIQAALKSPQRQHLRGLWASWSSL